MKIFKNILYKTGILKTPYYNVYHNMTKADIDFTRQMDLGGLIRCKISKIIFRMESVDNKFTNNEWQAQMDSWTDIYHIRSSYLTDNNIRDVNIMYEKYFQKNLHSII